jgi:hypothetical protein
VQKRVAGIHRPPVVVSTIEYALDLLAHGVSRLRAIQMKGHLGFIGPIVDAMPMRCDKKRRRSPQGNNVCWQSGRFDEAHLGTADVTAPGCEWRSKGT